VQNFTGQPAAISHTYLSPRSYLVVVTGFDALGDTSTTTAAITVNPRAALTVTINLPSGGVSAGVPAAFGISVSGLTTGAAISPVRVDFGEGTGNVTLNGNVTSVPHTYASAGLYPLTAIVTDTTGSTGTGSAGVIVTARSNPSVALASSKNPSSIATDPPP